MYTQCPECRTIFKLADADLAAAHGSVRCGDCAAVFDALVRLAEQLPPEPLDVLPLHVAASAPPVLAMPVFRPHADVPPPPAPTRASARARERSALPTFARTSPAPTGANWPWALGAVLLAVLLLGEIAWAERERWLDDARVRSWIDPICARIAACRLPLRRDTALLQLSSRDIRPHPSVPGALIVSATLRNDAAFAQPWPLVEVVLSDFDGKRIAMRRFRPVDYAADARTLATGIAPGASAPLSFEVVDPGRNAVAFEFRFVFE